MSIRGKQLGGIASRYPSDRYDDLITDDAIGMNDRSDPKFGRSADLGARKHRGPGRDENLGGKGRAVQMCVRPDENVVADVAGIPFASPQKCLLHDDATRAELHCSSVCGDDSAVEHPALLANHHISGDHRVRSDVGRVSYLRSLSSMLDDHCGGPYRRLRRGLEQDTTPAVGLAHSLALDLPNDHGGDARQGLFVEILASEPGSRTGLAGGQRRLKEAANA